jgi:serine/threonine protein kinase
MKKTALLFKIIMVELLAENIVLTVDKSIAKITDFGLSRMLSTFPKTASLGAGTVSYIAPEIITGDKYSTKVDLW